MWVGGSTTVVADPEKDTTVTLAFTVNDPNGVGLKVSEITFGGVDMDEAVPVKAVIVTGDGSVYGEVVKNDDGTYSIKVADDVVVKDGDAIQIEFTIPAGCKADDYEFGIKDLIVKNPDGTDITSSIIVQPGTITVVDGTVPVEIENADYLQTTFY